MGNTRTISERIRLQDAPTRRPSAAERTAELVAIAITVGARTAPKVPADLAALIGGES